MALALRGVPEAEARRHSPDWVGAAFTHLTEEAQQRAQDLARLERARASLFAIVINMAVAAAFDESGAAASSLDELREQLLAETEEESLPWLLNPQAQGYDLDTIRAAGIAVPSVPAADTSPQEAAP